MRRLVVLVLASVFLAVSLAAGAERSQPLAVGKKASDFILLDQHGKPVRLSDLLATRQYVILAFYVMAFTPG